MDPPMRRIATILLLFVLLMNGRHSTKLALDRPAGFALMVRPLFPPGAARPAALGPFALLGAWRLQSAHPVFGGVSSLAALPDGRLIGVGDQGLMFRFDPAHGDDAHAYMAALPVPPRDRGRPAWTWDSESTQQDPATGRLWVGFELVNRICRYAAGFARVERCVDPRAMADWPETGGAEAMARLADGRFLVFSETGRGPHGGNDVLLFAGDPTEPGTPPPAHLGYAAPPGYRPTDALALGKGRLLVLNRRVSLVDGFTAALAIVDLPTLREGVLLRPRVVARIAPPLPSDNFEAMALTREAGRPVLWLASDDNHFVLQRSLLLKLAVPPDWVAHK
jgi:hypothetical protein